MISICDVLSIFLAVTHGESFKYAMELTPASPGNLVFRSYSSSELDKSKSFAERCLSVSTSLLSEIDCRCRVDSSDQNSRHNGSSVQVSRRRYGEILLEVRRRPTVHEPTMDLLRHRQQQCRCLDEPQPKITNETKFLKLSTSNIEETLPCRYDGEIDAEEIRFKSVNVFPGEETSFFCHFLGLSDEKQFDKMNSAHGRLEQLWSEERLQDFDNSQAQLDHLPSMSHSLLNGGISPPLQSNLPLTNRTTTMKELQEDETQSSFSPSYCPPFCSIDCVHKHCFRILETKMDSATPSFPLPETRDKSSHLPLLHQSSKSECFIDESERDSDYSQPPQSSITPFCPLPTKICHPQTSRGSSLSSHSPFSVSSCVRFLCSLSSSRRSRFSYSSSTRRSFAVMLMRCFLFLRIISMAGE